MAGKESIETGSAMVLDNAGMNNVCVTNTENKATGGFEKISAASEDCVRKYSRKKTRRISRSFSMGSVLQDSGVSTNITTYFTDKNLKEPPNVCLANASRVSLPRMDSHDSKNLSIDSPVKDCRKIFLEQMYQSLKTEGGLHDCIQDALLFHSEVDSTSTKKESLQFGEGISSSRDTVGVILNGSRNVSSPSTNTEFCKRALFGVLTSDKFAELYDLLLGNFQGLKMSSLFDIKTIESRVKEGAYESSPLLFHHDIQQVWSKLQIVGTEMAELAKSLSEKSSASWSDEGFMLESSVHPGVEQAEGTFQLRASSCRQCKEKAEGQNCLVCDYCEDSYHMFCIKPALKEIPLKSWYCTSCTEKGIGSPHENCVLCESMNAPKSLSTGVGDEELELEKSSNGTEEDVIENGAEILNCKICGNNVKNDNYKVCGHSLCISKYYHERCLTVKQRNSFGSCWYCPTCLCQNCLLDQDNDKIVICDGCDEALHIYCMQAPRDTIPRGKWFCAKCDDGLQRLQKVKRAYLNVEYKSREISARQEET
ncbi:PHD finger protein EHD3-like [Apium graveolens]|uniref:PHD finger protein EHD3-like n=1 Tax=Apium graveolens TaxID=4045 RepID=UPI003D7A1ADE